MSRPSGLVLRTSRRAPMQRPDRLSLAVAGPIVLALSLLCWAAVWEVARLVF